MNLSDVNIADALGASALRVPSRVAMHVPRPKPFGGRREYEAHTYAELDAQADAIATGLLAEGLAPGDRVALLVKPSFELFALVFGLFRAGLVPVLVDPGIGRANMGACLDEARPVALIGIPAALAAARLLSWASATIRLRIAVGGRFPGAVTLSTVSSRGRGGALPTITPEQTAAIVFTSGSTGAPKGVVYTQRNFSAQVSFLQSSFAFEDGEIDVPTFPLFALFDPVLGMTTVLPAMDATRPGFVDPDEIFGPIRRFNATNLFGSPALLDRLGRSSQAPYTRLPSLRRVLSAGAPVPTAVIRRILPMLQAGVEVFTPYGATEALPVAIIGSNAVLEETAALTDRGAGVCVGKPVLGVTVALLPISDEAIERRLGSDEVPRGEVGEITVNGANVTERYLDRPDATRAAKIPGTGEGVWHRMGDLGRFDDHGRLWFCGRKAHRVVVGSETLFTDPTEGVFNTHPDVRRTALVGVRGEAILCVELEPGTTRKHAEIERELQELIMRHPSTKPIRRFLFHPSFPVDIRHNSKIFREKLAIWAAEELAS
jgi:olefin beta-lactone synthetase